MTTPQGQLWTLDEVAFTRLLRAVEAKIVTVAEARTILGLPAEQTK
jgi:hypothetical protein